MGWFSCWDYYHTSWVGELHDLFSDKFVAALFLVTFGLGALIGALWAGGSRGSSLKAPALLSYRRGYQPFPLRAYLSRLCWLLPLSMALGVALTFATRLVRTSAVCEDPGPGWGDQILGARFTRRGFPAYFDFVSQEGDSRPHGRTDVWAAVIDTIFWTGCASVVVVVVRARRGRHA